MLNFLDSTTNFPDKYDISEETQKAILDNCSYWLSRMYHALDIEDDDLYKKYKNNLDSFIAAMRNKGYHIRYDWAGHRGQYFLATKLDYILQQEYEGGIL